MNRPLVTSLGNGQIAVVTELGYETFDTFLAAKKYIEEQREMSNFTPGPWRAFTRGMGDTSIVSRSRVVAIVDFRDAEDGLEFQANAQLIATAPKLLNALELAEATIVRLERHAPGSANGTLDIVRAAIAEALGK